MIGLPWNLFTAFRAGVFCRRLAARRIVDRELTFEGEVWEDARGLREKLLTAPRQPIPRQHTAAAFAVALASVVVVVMVVAVASG